MVRPSIHQVIRGVPLLGQHQCKVGLLVAQPRGAGLERLLDVEGQPGAERGPALWTKGYWVNTSKPYTT